MPDSSCSLLTSCQGSLLSVKELIQLPIEGLALLHVDQIVQVPFDNALLDSEMKLLTVGGSRLEPHAVKYK